MSKENDEIELLKQEYLTQIRGVFPLHRLILLIIMIMIAVAAQNTSFPSIIEGIINLEIRYIVDLGAGFFMSIKVLDILIAISMLISGTISHRILRWILLIWIKRTLKIEKIAKNMSQKSAKLINGSIADYFELKRSENEARVWSAKISRLSLMSESSMALFISFLYAGYYGNITDYIISIIFLLCSFFALYRSFISFLREYLPHSMHLKGLLGQRIDINFPDNHTGNT